MPEINLLLEGSVSDRVKQFKQRVVQHDIYIRVKQELLDTIAGASTADILLLVGPTGVGKSTLCQAVIKTMLEHEMNEMEQNPGYIPIGIISASTPTRGNFNWKDHFRRCLEFYSEPYIEYKQSFPHLLQASWQPSTDGLSSSDAPALQRALEKCMEKRRTQVFFIDEAQALLRVTGGRGLLDQMDVLKTISNNTRVKHVLVGTYELLMCIGLSGQLDRRSKIIHFPCYQGNIDSDQEQFRDLLFSLQRNLPLKNQPDLVSEIEYFFERSAGCSGILKDWLTRCLEASLKKGEETLLWNIIHREALTNYQLDTLITEIFEGEASFTGPSDDDIRRRLKLDAPVDKAATTKDPNNPRKKGNKRPGQRKPKRDPIGASNAVG